MALEAKLQSQMDCEDRRVKELTEAVLYDLLPALLHAVLPDSSVEDPLQVGKTRLHTRMLCASFHPVSMCNTCSPALGRGTCLVCARCQCAHVCSCQLSVRGAERARRLPRVQLQWS